MDKIRGLEDKAREIRESRGHQKIFSTGVSEDQRTRRPQKTYGLELQNTEYNIWSGPEDKKTEKQWVLWSRRADETPNWDALRPEGPEEYRT